eukprot:s90_g56.t1
MGSKPSKKEDEVKEEKKEEERKEKKGDQAKFEKAALAVRLITLAAILQKAKGQGEEEENGDQGEFHMMMWVYTAVIVILTLLIQWVWKVGVRREPTALQKPQSEDARSLPASSGSEPQLSDQVLRDLQQRAKKGARGTEREEEETTETNQRRAEDGLDQRGPVQLARGAGLRGEDGLGQRGLVQLPRDEIRGEGGLDQRDPVQLPRETEDAAVGGEGAGDSSSSEPTSSEEGRPLTAADIEAALEQIGREEAQLWARELYHRYQREIEGDVLVQLELRLNALVEHGKTLRATLFEEESKAQGSNALPQAREAYRNHLQERQKLRSRRDEKEAQFEQICKNLYAKWRELRQIRQDYGFTSTPWRLTAQAQEHDPSSDGERKARNIDAEVEEMSYLQGLPVDRLRDQLQSKWDAAKRPAGMPSYRFDLSATTQLTSTEVLRSRAFDGIVGEAEAILASEELQRRKLVSRARVRVECRVQNRVVGCSPSIPISWETAGTSAAVTLLEEAGLPGSPESLRPVHSFNLAVHVMPQNLSLVVYVSAGGLWNRWHATQEVEVDLPSLGKVTHAAVLDQRLLFGPDDDDGAVSSFRGEVAVCVSWPGEGRDSVVPPMAPRMDAAVERAECWSGPEHREPVGAPI